jgi:BioD-like phosphotransacetylase family protein
MAHEALLTKPENTTTPRLFVAATRQNDGKTTACLGLFAALQQKLNRVGYIKPIGQRFVKLENHLIDEDTVLFDRTYDIHTPIESMSPVAIDSTFTRRYLDDPAGMHPVLIDKVLRAFDRSAYEKDVIIIEGSGHAGVGSICDLSNAQIARLLGAKAIIVARGGIGKPVDELALNKSLFDKFGIEVIGAILNKVDPSRIEVVRNYTAKALDRLGIPLLGMIPVTDSLTFPNLGQVVEALDARWLNGRKVGQYNRVLNVVVGAMTAASLIDYIKPGVLVITPGDREDVLLLTIAACSVAGQKPLAGIVLTRNILPSPHIMEMIAQTNIPVVISREESYAVASNINSMTVKTQPQDADKIPLIKKLVAENIDLEVILKSLGNPG